MFLTIKKVPKTISVYSNLGNLSHLTFYRILSTSDLVKRTSWHSMGFPLMLFSLQTGKTAWAPSVSEIRWAKRLFNFKICFFSESENLMIRFMWHLHNTIFVSNEDPLLCGPPQTELPPPRHYVIILNSSLKWCTGRLRHPTIAAITREAIVWMFLSSSI